MYKISKYMKKCKICTFSNIITNIISRRNITHYSELINIHVEMLSTTIKEKNNIFHNRKMNAHNTLGAGNNIPQYNQITKTHIQLLYDVNNNKNIKYYNQITTTHYQLLYNNMKNKHFFNKSN